MNKSKCTSIGTDGSYILCTIADDPLWFQSLMLQIACEKWFSLVFYPGEKNTILYTEKIEQKKIISHK